MLTQTRVLELFEYREDGELIRRESRGGAKVGAVAGCPQRNGYRQTYVDGKNYSNHRLVFLWHHGYLPENQVDHIDRNPGNNRIENLREVGQTCNSRNSRVRADNSSGVVGVSWFAERENWQSKIRVPRRQILIGRFTDFTEAVAHRLAAEQCLGWEGCHSSTSAYLYMQKYMETNYDSTANQHHNHS